MEVTQEVQEVQQQEQAEKLGVEVHLHPVAADPTLLMEVVLVVAVEEAMGTRH
jgi:hypothetical protein